MKRALDVLSVLLVIGMAFWWAIPSSLFIRTVSLTVDGDVARFTRELPRGEVRARWHSEITLIDGEEFECNSGGWRIAHYQQVPGNTVRYALGNWADDCIAAGPPFYITTTRQVLLWGFLPLRPSTNRTEIQGTREVTAVPVTPHAE